MRVKQRVTPPLAPNPQQGKSGKAGANGSSQSMTLAKLRRFQAAQKGKRAGKYKGGTAVADDEEDMTDFDAALVGAYERLHVDADAQGQSQQQQHQQPNEGEDAKSDEKAAAPLPKFLPAHARRI